MRISEILRLVFINLAQNKFKVILTSIGIVVGSATIMMVIAIGTGSKEEVAEQFKNLNAGAVDISYDSSSSSASSQQGMGGLGLPSLPSMRSSGSGFGGFGGSSSKKTSDSITLTSSDMEDLQAFVPGLSSATISYTTTSDVDGGELSASKSYSIAGVQSNYFTLSNLKLAIGETLTDSNNESKEKVCVLGNTVANDVFGSTYAAYGQVVYIDSRPYLVSGVISEMGTVASGISPDTAIFIPYQTGIKYLTGTHISPTITVIAENVDNVSKIKTEVTDVLSNSYPNAEFTVSDAGTKMQAASASNQTLQLLLIAMAVIVFIVGGIGIMNVLFVSVKERTNEIGILKALGCSRRDILLEFLMEASCMSMIGAVLGILVSLGITPLVELFSVRVDLSVAGALLALFFGVITGSMFGFYPAYKASRLIPVAALNQE
jgi:putative ABC transport system permease protein